MSATVIATAAIALHHSPSFNRPAIVAPAQVGPLAHSPNLHVGHQPARPVVVTAPQVRPIVARPVTPVYRPITIHPTHRPVVIERGHGPVVHRPVVIHPIVREPIATVTPIYQGTVYRPVSYAQPTIVDNCNTESNAYVGPIGGLPDSYSNGYEALTSPTAMYGGEETIALGAQVGPIDNLVLQANAGTTRIDTVEIQFVDGTTQDLQIGTAINASNPQITLDLGHSEVASLTVFGSSGAGSTYQLLAA
jgi:hypothetical protein